MAYTAWSVVFGEQPTAAKWNQLGENDAGFKNGDNIDDDAILARHISSFDKSNLTNGDSNPYKFRARQGSTQTLTASTWTKAQLNTEDFDTNGDFNNASYRYTAPIDGYYAFQAQVWIASAGISTGFAEAALYKNGSALIYGHRQVGSGSSSTLPRLRMDCLLQLTAGDYIELYGYCSESSRNIVGDPSTYLSGFLVSRT